MAQNLLVVLITLSAAISRDRAKKLQRLERRRIMNSVNVIGAGLAGCEATYQLIRKNIKVNLYEMRPKKQTGAHHTSYFSELVCSNSLRSDSLQNGVGLLKEEMRLLDSLIMKFADANKVPAGPKTGEELIAEQKQASTERTV